MTNFETELARELAEMMAAAEQQRFARLSGREQGHELPGTAELRRVVENYHRQRRAKP